MTCDPRPSLGEDEPGVSPAVRQASKRPATIRLKTKLQADPICLPIQLPLEVWCRPYGRLCAHPRPAVDDLSLLIQLACH
jgi:hypothetical protein